MVPPMRDAGTVSRTDHPRTDARPEAPDAVAWGQDAAGTGEAPDLTVGAVAALAGVSVRTLHYWDTIGLVGLPALLPGRRHPPPPGARLP